MWLFTLLLRSSNYWRKCTFYSRRESNKERLNHKIDYLIITLHNLSLNVTAIHFTKLLTTSEHDQKLCDVFKILKFGTFLKKKHKLLFQILLKLHMYKEFTEWNIPNDFKWHFTGYLVVYLFVNSGGYTTFFWIFQHERWWLSKLWWWLKLHKQKYDSISRVWGDFLRVTFKVIWKIQIWKSLHNFYLSPQN